MINNHKETAIVNCLEEYLVTIYQLVIMCTVNLVNENYHPCLKRKKNGFMATPKEVINLCTLN